MAHYIKQKNTGESVIVVTGNPTQALAQFPDLFEEATGEIPVDAEYLNFETAED